MSTGGLQTMGLGGALKAAVESVIEEGAAGISVADAGTEAAFLDAWTRTLTAHARHLRRQGLELAAPVVVAYADNCADVGEKLRWTKRPMIGGSPTDPLAGLIVVGTAEIGGYVRPAKAANSDEATDAIQGAGLGDSLTVALLSNSMMVIWPEGLNAEISPQIQRDLDDAPIVFDLQELERQLELFYERIARQTTSLWADRATRTTVSSPESAVQRELLIFLYGKFSEAARIKPEMKIGNGRADITLTPMKGYTASAVLELKVTRDFMTPRAGTATPTAISLQDNIEWANSGVAQTAAYRDDERLDAGYLCVYDFCAGNRQEISQAIEEAALDYEVIAKRYWITASNLEHRTERYPQRPAGAPAVK